MHECASLMSLKSSLELLGAFTVMLTNLEFSELMNDQGH